jgi:Protein of unknown function (DUF2934)
MAAVVVNVWNESCKHTDVFAGSRRDFHPSSLLRRSIMAPPKKASKTTPPTPATPAAAPQRSEVKGSGTTKSSPLPKEISSSQIELRAYEIFAGRGYAPGDPTADWLEAERQLKAGL